MKKYICGAAALLLVATMLFGCGKDNVSNHPGGKITEPTSVMPTIIPEPTMTTGTTHSTSEPTHETTKPMVDPTATTGMTETTPDGTTGTEETSNHSQTKRSNIGG